jgi:hypothetical protein
MIAYNPVDRPSWQVFRRLDAFRYWPTLPRCDHCRKRTRWVLMATNGS